jgi:translation elongation factor EF-Tu-like GTPase
MRALIKWLSKESGGRTTPAIGPKYFGVAKFKTDDINYWKKKAWSVELEFSNKEQRVIHEANIRFLVAEAPHNLLEKGIEFELLEGEKSVCSVRII